VGLSTYNNESILTAANQPTNFHGAESLKS